MASKNAIQAIKHLESLGIDSIELSGGKYIEDLSDELVELAHSKVNLQIHNYFPVPKIPFVLNLASDNEDILKASFEHCKNALVLASKLKNKRYSVHAGFCCDPKVRDLGRSFNIPKKVDRNKHIDLFIKTLSNLKKYSEDLGTDLYIENNNTINDNVFNQKSTLLCSDMKEMKMVKDSVGVKALIDIGHLIVSANSLELNEKKELLLSSKIADAYHLSTNNRLRDQNKPISEEKPLLEFVSKTADFYTIEVYAKDETIINDYYFLKEFLL